MTMRRQPEEERKSKLLAQLEELEADKIRRNIEARLAARQQAEEAAAAAPKAEPSMADLLKPPSVAEAKSRRPKKLPRGRNPYEKRRIRVHSIGHDIAEARQRARIAENSPQLSDAEIKAILDEAKERENGP